MSGFKEGVGDVGRSAYENIGDTYQAFLQGRLAPEATMTGDMVTTQPAETIGQSYEAALREHEAAEQQEQLDNGYGPYEDCQPEPDIGSP